MLRVEDLMSEALVGMISYADFLGHFAANGQVPFLPACFAPGAPI